MAEFLESISRVSEGLKAANAVEEYTSSLSLLLTESRFYANIRELGLSGDTFAFEGDTGNVQLTNNGEPVDLDNSIKNIENRGDIVAALRDLRVPEDVISEPPVQRYAAEYKARWDNQPGNVDIKSVKNAETTGEKIEYKLESAPSSYSEMTEAFKRDKSFANEMNNRFNKLKKQVEDFRNNGKEFKTGKWIKRVVFGGGIFIGGVAIFNEINKHKTIMNGCWVVDIRTGEKCKVGSLTCNTISADEAKYMCGSYNYCGEDGLSSCFDPKTCVKRAKDKTCEQTIGKCQTGTCNILCSQSSTLKIPPGKRLQCVSVNFWGAAEDFLGESLSEMFGKNFWWYIGVGFVVLVVILIFLS